MHMEHISRATHSASPPETQPPARTTRSDKTRALIRSFANLTFMLFPRWRPLHRRRLGTALIRLAINTTTNVPASLCYGTQILLTLLTLTLMLTLPLVLVSAPGLLLCRMQACALRFSGSHLLIPTGCQALHRRALLASITQNPAKESC